MYISPEKASFKKSMRGYKARQVDAYIESLCSEFAAAEEDYRAQIARLERENEQLRTQLAEYEQKQQRRKQPLQRIRSKRQLMMQHTKTWREPMEQRLAAAGQGVRRIAGKTWRAIDALTLRGKQNKQSRAVADESHTDGSDEM